MSIDKSIAERAVLLILDDPQSPDPVNAFCVLVEAHINWEKQLLVVIYNCWRSQQAFLAKKEPFTQLKVDLREEDDGKAFLTGNQTNNQFMAELNQFVLTHKLTQGSPVPSS